VDRSSILRASTTIVLQPVAIRGGLLRVRWRRQL